MHSACQNAAADFQLIFTINHEIDHIGKVTETKGTVQLKLMITMYSIGQIHKKLGKK